MEGVLHTFRRNANVARRRQRSRRNPEYVLLGDPIYVRLRNAIEELAHGGGLGLNYIQRRRSQ